MEMATGMPCLRKGTALNGGGGSSGGGAGSGSEFPSSGGQGSSRAGNGNDGGDVSAGSLQDGSLAESGTDGHGRREAKRHRAKQALGTSRPVTRSQSKVEMQTRSMRARENTEPGSTGARERVPKTGAKPAPFDAAGPSLPEGVPAGRHKGGHSHDGTEEETVRSHGGTRRDGAHTKEGAPQRRRSPPATDVCWGDGFER